MGKMTQTILLLYINYTYLYIMHLHKEQKFMQKYHLQNRPNREINDKEQIRELLKKGKYATLALCRKDEPYIVSQ